MNWKLYFKHIRTEEDYWKLRNSGFFFEFFPDGYQTWQEHLEAMNAWDLYG